MATLPFYWDATEPEKGKTRYDKQVDVHNPDEKFKHRRVKIYICFTAVGLICMPDEKELLVLMDEIRNEKSA